MQLAELIIMRDDIEVPDTVLLMLRSELWNAAHRLELIGIEECFAWSTKRDREQVLTQLRGTFAELNDAPRLEELARFKWDPKLAALVAESHKETVASTMQCDQVGDPVTQMRGWSDLCVAAGIRVMAWESLAAALDARRTFADRQRALGYLKRIMGDEAFAAGVMPC